MLRRAQAIRRALRGYWHKTLRNSPSVSRGVLASSDQGSQVFSWGGRVKATSEIERTMPEMCSASSLLTLVQLLKSRQTGQAALFQKRGQTSCNLPQQTQYLSAGRSLLQKRPILRHLAVVHCYGHRYSDRISQPGCGFELRSAIAVSHTPPGLASGWGYRGRRLSREQGSLGMQCGLWRYRFRERRRGRDRGARAHQVQS